MQMLHFGTYTEILYSYVLHSAEADDGLQNRTAFTRHLLLSADPHGKTVGDIAPPDASRYRKGTRAIPKDVVALFQKSTARRMIVEYVEDFVVPFIVRGKKQQLIMDFVNIIEQDATIDDEFKDGVLKEAAPERLPAFLADLLIYSVGIDPTKPAKERRSNLQSLKRTEGISNIGLADGMFVGRADLLKSLDDGFKEGYRSQFIGGEPESGKSRLALEYAQRHAAEYKITCWINAWNENCVRSSVVDFFELAGVSYDDAFPDRLSDLFCRFCDANEDWLIIFDNVNLKLSGIEKYIPTGKGHIIFTGNPGSGDEIQGCKYHTVGALSDNDRDDARLVSLCDGQPAPLALMTSYIQKSDWVDCDTYLQMLQDKNILAYEKSPYHLAEAVFEIKMSEVYNRKKYYNDKICMAAEQFLMINTLCSLVDFDLQFLSSRFPILPDPLGDICENEETRKQLVEYLRGFGFFEIREGVLHSNAWLRSPAEEYFRDFELSDMLDSILNRIENSIIAIRENRRTENADAIIALAAPYTKRIFLSIKAWGTLSPDEVSQRYPNAKKIAYD